MKLDYISPGQYNGEEAVQSDNHPELKISLFLFATRYILPDEEMVKKYLLEKAQELLGVNENKEMKGIEKRILGLPNIQRNLLERGDSELLAKLASLTPCPKGVVDGENNYVKIKYAAVPSVKTTQKGNVVLAVIPIDEKNRFKQLQMQLQTNSNWTLPSYEHIETLVDELTLQTVLLTKSLQIRGDCGREEIKEVLGFLYDNYSNSRLVKTLPDESQMILEAISAISLEQLQPSKESKKEDDPIINVGMFGKSPSGGNGS
jgi:hypothetical protein